MSKRPNVTELYRRGTCNLYRTLAWVCLLMPFSVLAAGKTNAAAPGPVPPFVITRSFTVPGTYAFTVPGGVTSITVETWGGGGRGGSKNAGSDATGGGGGGAYSKEIVTVTGGQTFSVNVGAGSTSNSSPGLDSWFSPGTVSEAVVLAKGGSSVPTNDVSGYPGGSASLGIGSIRYSGGHGGNAPGPEISGGGGSSAGYFQNGTNGYLQVGGVAPAGGGNGGNGRTSQGSGLPGISPGGGGGGAVRSGLGSPGGGNGANGQVLITYNYTVDAGDDITQCDNALFSLKAFLPPFPYTVQWSVISGTAYISDPDNLTTPVHVPSGMSATVRLSISNGTVTQTDDIVLTHQTGCAVTCSQPIHPNGNLEDAGYTASYDLNFHGTDAFLIQQGNRPIGWTPFYGNQTPDPSSFTGAYYLYKSGSNGDPFSGLHALYLGGDGFGISAFESTGQNACGRTYRISVQVAAFSKQATQQNAPFTLGFLATGSQVSDFVSEYPCIAPASTSWNNLNWQRYSFEVTVPHGQFDQMKVYLRSGDNIHGIVVDDFCLDEVSPVSFADAGADIFNCDSDFVLDALPLAPGYTGQWSVVSGSATLSEPGSPTSPVTLTSGNEAHLRWSVTENNNQKTITAIDPFADGGFEAGSSFSDNGWVAVNQNYNRWTMGTSATPLSGNASAFIAQYGNENNSYFTTVSQTVHLYKEVVIHPDASDIELSFRWKGIGEVGYDRLLVYTAPAGFTPQAGVPASPSTSMPGATLVSALTLHSANNYRNQLISLPATLAGTTVQIIFTWQNDAVSGSQPPASVDEISLKYQITGCTSQDDLVIAYNTSALTVSADSTCAGDTATIFASGCSDGTLVWSTGATGSSIQVTPTVTTLYSVTCTPGIPDNILLNPGFESTTDLQYWTASNQQVAVTSNPQHVHQGNRAAVLDGSSGLTTLSQPLDVVPGERYVLKAWAKTDNTSIRPVIRHQFFGPGWSEISIREKENAILSSEYLEYTQEFIVPPGAAHMMISADVEGGLLYVDHWSLHRYVECESTASGEVFVYPLPDAPFLSSVTQPTCYTPSGTVVLSGLPATGPWTITRFPGNISYLGSGATFTINNLPPDTTVYFIVTNFRGCTSSDSLEVTIQPIPSDPVLSGEMNTCVGQTGQVLPGSGGTWISSSPGIATVNNQGLVSGVAAGNVVLTYTRTSDGCDQNVSFTVNPNPVIPFIGVITHPTCITPTGSVILQNLPANGPWTITRLPDGFIYTGSGTTFTAGGIPPNGNYSFNVEDVNGCISLSSAVIYIQPIPANPVLGGDAHACEGTQAQVLPATGGVWSGNNAAVATVTASGLVSGIIPGTVELTFTRTADGCSSAKLFTIYNNPLPPVADSIIHPTCINPTGTVQIQGLPDGSPWEITVFPGSLTFTDSTGVFWVTGLGPDETYSFQITDDKGCISALSVPVTVLPIPEDPILGGDTFVCVGATAQVLPDTLGFWSSTNPSIAIVDHEGIVTGVGPGIVTLTYTRNIDGCQSSKTIEVFSNPLPPVVGVITQPTCYNPYGSVELSGLPEDGPWILTALPGNQTFTGTGADYTVMLLDTATTFTFTVTDFRGCTSPVSAQAVINPVPPNPVLGGDTLICVGEIVQFLPSVNGSWTSENPSIATITPNGQATGIAPGTAVFTYIRTSDGCDQSIQIPVYSLPVSPVIDQILQPTCTVPTGRVNLSGLPENGSWTITIFPGGTEIQGTGNTFQITGLPPDGEYFFTVSDFRGCSVDFVGSAVILPIPEDPIITGTDFVCIGAATALEPSTGGTWVSANPSVATVNNMGIVTGVAASTVTLTFTRTADGCSSDLLFTVHPLPVAPGISTITQPTCLVPSGSVELIGLPANGDWVISRNPGDTLYMNSGTNILITDLPPGMTYTFSVVNQFNCLSLPSAPVIVLPVPDNPVLGGDTLICEGSQTQLLPQTGGIWTSSDEIIASVTPDGLVEGNSEGTVMLTYTRNTDGCSSVLLLTVYPMPLNQLTAPEVCQDSLFIIYNTPQSGLADYTYFWSGPNGFTDTLQNVIRPGSFVSMTGWYYVTITDARGCQSVDSIFGTVNPRPFYTVTITDVSVYEGNDGAIDLTALGGTPPYTYAWSNSATSQDISGLVHGLYMVTITDANGCMTINQPEFSVGHPADCSGFRTQTQSGWGEEGNGSNLGAYRDSIFAAAFPSGLTIGCNNTLHLSSSQAVEDFLPCYGNPDLLPAGDTIDPACINNEFAAQLVTLTLSATFDLYDPDFSESDENLMDLRVVTGPLYRKTVGQLLTEANNLIGGCGSAFSLADLSSALLLANENYVDGKITGDFLRCCQINVTTSGGTICSGNSINISVTGSNGIEPFTYEWSDGLGNGAVKNVAPTSTKTYTVTITDDLGCKKITSVTVFVNPSPVVSVSVPAVCEGSVLNITPFVNNGTPSFTYNWTGPENFTSTNPAITLPAATLLMSGTYFVTVTDIHGCSHMASGIATVHPKPMTPLIDIVHQPLCVPPTGSVGLSGLPAAGPWAVSSTPGVQNISGNGTTVTYDGLLPSTTYRFRVTDQHNCISELSTPVDIGPVPPDPQVGGNTETCVGGTTYADPGNGGIWTSSNAGVAVISVDGIVSALNPGTTILTFTQDSTGCTNFMEYTVYANPGAPVIENVTQPTCYTPTGSVELSGLPTNGFWTILRYPGAIPYVESGESLVINGLPIESSYSFIVINGDNCISNVSANAIIGSMPTNPVLTGPSAICVGSGANFYPNAGGTWISSNPSVATINNAGTVAGVSAGTVTFTHVRLSDGCQNSVVLTVHPNPETPVIDEVVQPTCILPSGTVKFSGLPVSSGWTITRLPDNVQVTGTGSTYQLGGLPPGQTYSFIVSNNFSCVSLPTENITINPIPSDPVLSGDNQVCIGQTGQVFPAVGGNWTSSNPTIATVNANGEVTGTGAGLVTLTYTRISDGCDASIPFNVRPVPNIPFLGTPVQPTCILPEGSISISNLPVTGSWTLTRLPDLVSVSGSGTTYTWSGLLPGNTYQFRVSNPFGCTSGNSANAIIQNIPSDPVISGAVDVCLGDTTQVFPTSGGSWISSDPGIASFVSGGTLAGISPGTVTITYTRNQDGCDSSMLFTVHDTPLAPIISLVNQPTCVVPFGSVLAENLPSSGSWTLYRSPGQISYQGTGPSFMVQSLPVAGNYSFHVVDGYGCISSSSTNVQILDIPEDPVLGGDNEICSGQTAWVIPGSGGSWSSSNIAIATIQASGEVTGVSPGLVTLTFTRTTDGCDAQKSFSVYSNPLPPFVGQVTQPTCIEPTGSVLLTNLPATGNWILQIQPGGQEITGSGTQYLISGLTPNTNYNFTVQNESDCSSVSSGTVFIQSIPPNPVLGGEDFVCQGSQIQLTPNTGGTWQSSHPEFASINSMGVVTGIGAGYSTMTYVRTEDGCFFTKEIEIKSLPNAPGLQQVVQPTCITPRGSVALENLPLSGNWVLVRNPGNNLTAGSGSTFTVTDLPIERTYFFQVIDVYGCKSFNSLPVVIDSTPVRPVLSGDNIVCLGETSQLLPASGGTWQSSEPQFISVTNDGLVTSLQPGSAILSYTRDADGCRSSMNFFVNPNPVANIVGQTIFCFGSLGFLEGTGGVIYSWSTGETTPSIFIQNSGTYSLTITNSFGCQDSTAITTTISTGLTADIDYQGSVCYVPGKQISAVAYGGISPYTYQWSGPNAMSSTQQTITVANSGNYYLTITDAAGCTAVTQGFVYQSYEPLVVSLNTSVCEGQSVELNVVSQTAIAYQWGSNAGNATTAGVTVYPSIPSTTYQVTVTNDLGCTSLSQITIPVIEKPDISLSGPDVICAGDTTTFTVNQTGYWESTNPGIAYIDPTGIVTGLSGGTTRFIFYNGQNDCPSDTSASITVLDLPVVTVNGPDLICAGQTTQLLPASGGSWQSLNPAVATASISGLVTGVTGGSAQFVFTDSTSLCSAFLGTEIQVEADIELMISGPSELCVGENIFLEMNVSGGFWSSSDSNIATINNSGIVTGVNPGTVIITYDYATLNCTYQVNRTMVIHGGPAVYFSGDTTVCEGQSTSLMPSSGGTWASTNPFIASVNATGGVTTFQAGSVSFIFTADSTGCASQPSQVLIVQALPYVEVTGSGQICMGSTLTLSPAGIWSGSNPMVAQVNSSGMVTGISPGTALFTYTDSLTGCSSLTQIPVTVHQNPTAVLDFHGSICLTDNSQLSVLPSGGSPGYTYLWTGPSGFSGTSQSIFITQNGLYQTTVTDNNGCTANVSGSVYERFEPIITGFNSSVCAGEQASLTVVANQASSYTWSANAGNSTQPNVVVTPAGPTSIYTVTVTNTLGCAVVAQASIIVHPKPIVTIAGPDTICVGSLTYVQPVTGGSWVSVPPGVVSITNSGIVTGLTTGLTRFIFTNTQTGCVSDTSGFLVVNEPTPIGLDGPDELCSLETTQLSPMSGGTWQTLDPEVAVINQQGLVTGLSAGVALFSFTNDSGCISSNPISVTVHDKPEVTLNGDNQICVGTTTQFLPSSGGIWESTVPSVASIQTNGLVTGISEGQAAFVYTNSTTGCVSDTTPFITVNDSIEIQITGPDEICVGSTTQLSPSANGIWISNQPYLAGISPSGQVTALQPGVVTFTYISNVVQCFAGTSQPITIHSIPTVSMEGDNNVCLGDSILLTASGSGYWTSSDPSVAAVDENGIAVAIGPGTAYFTFTDSITGCMANPTNTLSVNAPPVVSLNGINLICAGTTTNLSPTNGGNWISTNESVAIVTSSGLVSGLQAGHAQFIFFESGSGCASAPTDTVTVEATPIALLTGEEEICIGDTSQVSPISGGSWVSLQPSVASINTEGRVTGLSQGIARFVFTSQNGCVSEPTPWLTVHGNPQTQLTGNSFVCIGEETSFIPASGGSWLSENPLVATINAQGVVTGLSPGNTRFMFTDTVTGCASVYTDWITVHPNPVVGIQGNTAICAGQTTQLTPTTGGQWISLDPSVAGVNLSGLVNGLTAGSAGFRFTSFSTGCSSDLANPVIVYDQPDISLDGPSVICVGNTTHLLPGSGGIWTAQHPAIASVNSTGLVTGLQAGTARFIFTETATGCVSSSFIQITVQSRPSVTLNGPPLICIGGHTQLLPSSGGTWTSADTTIATINQQGLVTGVASGQVQFTFTTESNGCTSGLSPVVTVHPDAMLALAGPSQVCLGYTTQLTSVLSGIWYSQDEQKASITSTGVVTGRAPGKANFYFVETATGCQTEFTRDLITISHCIDPDLNVTLISTPVTGNMSTNDEVPAGVLYQNNPVLIAKPEGAFASLAVQADGTYSFTGNLPGQYRYLVEVCLPGQSVNCPQVPLTIHVTDPDKMQHCLIVNTDIVNLYMNETVQLPVLENDACINSTGCQVSPSNADIPDQPAHGVAVFRADHTIEYTPDLNFIGVDTVTYRICAADNPSNCQWARMVVIVKDTSADISLSATDDFYFMNKNLSLDSVLVMLNDVSPEGNPFAVTASGTEASPVMITQGSYYITETGRLHFMPSHDYVGPVDIVYEICDNTGYCVKATAHILVLDNLKIKIRAYLEGALTENGDQRGPDNRPLMRDDLRINAFTNSASIPSFDPYSYPTEYFDITPFYRHVGVGAQVEFRNVPDASQVFGVTGADAIVDWIFVELRNPEDSTLILATRSGLIQRDGDIVDLDGVSDLEFPGIRIDSCYIVVRHRNHFDVMSRKVATSGLMDFTLPQAPVFDFGETLNDGYDYTGLALKSDVVPGYRSMWAGDFDNNGKLKFVNPGDDQNLLFFEVLTYPTNTGFVANYNYSFGYFQGDMDMNGKVKYDNPDDDKNFLFYQILFHPLNTNFISNFNNIIQQVPPSRE